MTASRRRISLSACAVALSLLLAASATAQALASVPAGPRLATVELIEKQGPRQGEDQPLFVGVSTFGERESGVKHLVLSKLTEGKGVLPMPFYGPAWLPDGSRIAFAGFLRGKGPGIYVAQADGGDPHLVKGTRKGRDPVFAPDGRTIAFSRTKTHFPHFSLHGGFSGKEYSSTTTWLLDTATGATRRLTPWRNGLSNVPDSFSPDGSVLALTQRDDRAEGPSVVLARTDGSGTTELAPLAEEAAISPDGTRAAFVGYQDATHIEAEENQDYDIGELYTMKLDGTELKRLTRNKQWIEGSPSWDPSGQRLAYVQAKADTSFVPALGLLFPLGNQIREMNAAGSCRRTIRSSPRVAFYGVAWQPGPGREVSGGATCG